MKLENSEKIRVKYYYKDKFGKDLDDYKKLFPKNSYFLYKTKYGGKLKLKVYNIVYSTNFLSEKKISFYHIQSKAQNSEQILTYEIENCTPCKEIRNEKIKKIL